MPSIDEHLKHPEIDIERHIGERCQSLANQLAGKTVIYLDLRFWIHVREAIGGESDDPVFKKIAHYLRKHVKQRTVVCPISTTVFQELLKIGKMERRNATVDIVEELSTGVTLMPEPDCVEAEIEELIYATMRPELRRLPRRVWTRLAYVYGNLYPTQTGFQADEELAIQKAFFDHMWELPLSSVFENIDPAKFESTASNSALAEKLNRENKAHKHEMKSFSQILSDELRGVADCGEPILRKIVKRVEISTTGSAYPLSSEPSLIGQNLLHKILLGQHASSLPTLHIQATLHAIQRWEYRDKQINGNHIFDYHHAAAALAYGNAFFTEGELARHIQHRRMNIANIHNCYVTSNKREALAFVKAISKSA